MIPALQTLFLALAAQAPPGVDPKAFDGIEQSKVDGAVERGVAALRRLKEEHEDPETDELVLLTFLHAGVDPADPLFKTMLGRVLAKPMERTYNVSLQAMVLEKLDPLEHRARLYECAQFLADNQCRNGQWSYGQPMKPLAVTLPSTPKKSGPTRVVSRVRVVPRPITTNKGGEGGTDSGDFSNSQYAALGVRACNDAGMEFPKPFLVKARDAWVDAQEKAPKPGRGAVASGGGPPPRGWSYDEKGGEKKTGVPYGSMTAGGVGAMVIYDKLLGIDWKRDPSVLAGLSWLGAHFAVDRNPEWTNKQMPWLHYYLYGLERAGLLFGTEQFGTHYWYREGTLRLLDTQKGGGWNDPGGGGWGKTIRDTCFAILFLRRATKPLVDVATGNAPKPK